MCGIAGVIDFSGSRKTNNSDLNKMLKHLKHRGPDGVGSWNNKNIAIGMRRLSIIDLENGMQPLFNEDKNLIIVGNGEIYNYKELFKLLDKKGHRRRTESDIEAIIHLYEEYGEKCLDKLEGMFAFIIYDKRNNKAFIARDRMGEKPLYYSIQSTKIYLSSEMKSLIKVVPNKEIDLDSINLYFHYYYIPEPRTVFKNIKKLEPGHYLLIDLNKNKVLTKQYWDPSSIKIVDKKNLVENINKKFINAVKKTLVADVDVAVSLSGGIDSSAILAIAASKYPKKIKAFTIGYEGSHKSDERMASRLIAKKYNVEHIELELKTKDVVNNFPKLVFDGDDPIADIAGHAIYSISHLAQKNKIKVLLGGLGGDELFWGYPWVRDITQNNYNFSKFDLFNKITPFKNGKKFLTNLTTKKFRSSIKQNLPENIYQPTNKLKTAIDYARAVQNKLRDIWLVSNCIAYNDRLSMASSVELRSPFLNHHLVKTAYENKKNVLSYKLDGKHYFKKAVAKYLPSKILNLPQKGFQPPIAYWLFGIIRKYIILLQNGFLVNQNIIARSKIRFIRITWFLNPFLWYSIYQLLVLEIWCREYILGIDTTNIYAKIK